jgi:UDP-N-acetyl-D-galactosamine dehydrogenase
MNNGSILEALLSKDKLVSVIGLGYVGLPLALAFARKFKVTGFDIHAGRISAMTIHQDPSGAIPAEAFHGCDITFTANPSDLKGASFHVVAVPTPVDEHKVPDLSHLLLASEYLGKNLKPGDYVIYESTVYPGCTEEECVPVLERYSGLVAGKDFKIGYSPERINPGDDAHALERIVKVVSATDDASLETISRVYDHVIPAGTFRAHSIRVAEAAKVIENAQRDLNIAFMNELSIIFDYLEIDTRQVLETARTKWNFLPFEPGLVGGHCIGVDPYYLVHKSLQAGYNPQVILSGRRINDGMPAFIAKRLVQMLIQQGKNPGASRILIMGITFKENISDIRNSKVADLVQELKEFSVGVHVYDPMASPEDVERQYGIKLLANPSNDYDAVVLAVAHRQFRQMNTDAFLALMRERPILLDLKGVIPHAAQCSNLVYWSL